MKKRNLIYKLAVLTLLMLQSCVVNDSKQLLIETSEYPAEVASEWNKKVLEKAIEEDNLLTLKGVRTAAMMHAAMHDALNSIVPEYGHYHRSISKQSGRVRCAT